MNTKNNKVSAESTMLMFYYYHAWDPPSHVECTSVCWIDKIHLLPFCRNANIRTANQAKPSQAISEYK